MTTKNFFGGRAMLPALLSFLLLPGALLSKNIGADPPRRACSSPAMQPSDTSSFLSISEGNLLEQVPVSVTRSTAGPTIDLTAVYNSYNADGSRAAVDSVMGYGWTHSYNVFLFTQFGAMFRYDGQGRVTKYGLGPGGTYITAAGYFETLVKTSSTTFTLTKKDKTVFTFSLVPGTPFLVAGPVWQLTQIVDRNSNTATLSYTGGNLTAITDTYGRTSALTYTAQRKLSTVTDPAGRVTTFQYDSTGHMLTRITDPLGNSIQYSYNSLYQLTAKTDKAGRTFSYAYSTNEPAAVKDSLGGALGTLSNAGNWATNASFLASYVTRTYTPATTTRVDGRGNTWQYQYDPNGYLTTTIAPDGSTTSCTYDPATLQVASSTDGNGNTTTYAYDVQGNLTQTTNALGHVTTYTYEPVFNMMTSMKDARGRTTVYAYDVNGNQLQETDPAGKTNKWTYNSNGNILTSTNKNGNTTTHLYDTSGNQIKVTDPLANNTIMTYDTVGNLLSTTDPNGNKTSYEYNGMNWPTKKTDALNNSSQTSYDPNGKVTQSKDRNGNTTIYQYNQRQLLTQTVDALGHPETYTYNGNDSRASWTDRKNHTTVYDYDLKDQLTKITDALANTTTTTYDLAGNPVSVTDGDGHTTNYGYDVLNRRTSTTDAAGGVTQYQYDTGTLPSCASFVVLGPWSPATPYALNDVVSFGGLTYISTTSFNLNHVPSSGPPWQVIARCGATPGSNLITGQIDGNGKVTYFKYDYRDLLVDVVPKVGSTADTITAADAVTAYTYDAVQNRLTLTEPNGNTTTWNYDLDNRKVKQVNAAGDTTNTTFDGAGNEIIVVWPSLNVTTNTYNALNRLIQVSDSAGLVSTLSYEPEGHRATYGDGNGNTTAYGYDADYHQVTVTDRLGKTTTTVYDFVGNPTQNTDRNGNVIKWNYDSLNRRTTATDALGQVTQSQYDAVGNLTRLTDPKGNATQFGYDPVNRPISETYADGTARSFTYDLAGNLLTRTDPIGHVTHYAYNDLYFLTGRTYPSASDAFSYDLSGRMLTAVRGLSHVTLAYDGGDRVTSSIQAYSPFSGTVGYSYSISGRTRTLTYPGGRVITEHSDARGRLDHIDDPASPSSIVQYSYNLDDFVTGRTYPRNATSTGIGYNANNWVLALTHANLPAAGLGFAQFAYGYENEGNKLFEQKLHDPTHSAGYQVDASYRLINYAVGTLVGSTVPVPSTQTSYNLDAVGNWASKTTNAVTQTRVHNSTNEVTQINATALTYDANGNLLNDGTYTYAYDEEDRLTQITRNSDSSVVGQYLYDALGRRISKNGTTIYGYDGARVIEEDIVGGPGVGTKVTYVYGNDIDEVLTMDRTTGAVSIPYYYHQNALGSVEAITDSSGTPVERYAYDAYGQVTVTNGAGVPVPPNASGTPHSAISNSILFTGRQLDEEAGLYYYRARYYDPQKGRFLQRDPDEYGDGTNLYEYALSNPTTYTDPSGLTTYNTTRSNIRNTSVAAQRTTYNTTRSNIRNTSIAPTGGRSGEVITGPPFIEHPLTTTINTTRSNIRNNEVGPSGKDPDGDMRWPTYIEYPSTTTINTSRSNIKNNLAGPSRRDHYDDTQWPTYVQYPSTTTINTSRSNIRNNIVSAGGDPGNDTGGPTLIEYPSRAVSTVAVSGHLFDDLSSDSTNDDGGGPAETTTINTSRSNIRNN